MTARLLRCAGGPALAVACSPSFRWVAPPEGDVRSFVVAVESADRPLLVGAEDVASALWVTGAEEGSTVHVAGYPASLAELGLARGDVSEGGACRSCALLEPTSTVRVSDERSEPGASLPATVLDWLVPDRQLRCGRSCRVFDTRELDVGAPVRVRWLAAAEPGRMLAGSDQGLVFEIDPAAATSTQRCRLPPGELLAASDGSDVWVFGAQTFARLEPWAGSPDAECPRTELVPTGAKPRYAAIRGSRTATEAFVLTATTAAILRFAEGSWREVTRFPRARSDGGLVIVGPGRAVVANASTMLVRTQEDRFETEDVELGGDISSIAWSDSVGLVAGVEYVGIVAPRGDEWVRLDTTEGWRNLGSMAIDGDRIWLVAAAGLHEYSAETGSCPPITTSGKAQAPLMLVLPDGRIIHNGPHPSRSSILTILTPREPAACPL